MSRKIIHVDMDAFYAAVEQRDDPRLRGRPVVVGGDPRGRGVVATASYEARRFGIRSAMPCAHAWRLCPQALFVRPRFEVYQSVSQQIRAVFARYTELIEPVGLDEAYLDVSGVGVCRGSATLIARDLKIAVRAATGLVASAGVSYNKFLAKIASDLDKPDGLAVITPEQGPAFIAKLPIGRFHGIGRATEQKMLALGIATGADLGAWSEARLVEHFGKAGHWYAQLARGEDDRPVCAQRVRKSLGAETTYARELAPMAGYWPALTLGPPWWFHDSLNGMRRYRDQVMETAGVYNTAGFNDDTRAFPSIPARHDLARRVDANWIASLVVRGIVDLNDAEAMIHDTAYRLAQRAYKFA